MSRIVLGVEYDGSRYAGWQIQAGKATVQGELERALTNIAAQPVTVLCAGRTDAGVHALEQVVHFDCPVERDLRGWVMGGNSHLPDDIRITWAKPAVDDFHARYSAIARFYRYVILNRAMKSALLRDQATWCYQTLDAERMHRAAQHLLGEHDFSSFRAQSCQSVSPYRLMYFIDVVRDGDKVVIDLCANAFLHHMVRNIAGVLIDIGGGKQPEDWTLHLLGIKDRAQAASTAPPHGLHLAGVFYPKRYGVPAHPVFSKLPKDAKRFD
ncbi:tRNA pseudouridine(38-40) synthase TruA [Methylomonas sp. LWB]|uniref:tRNA pseudouridine(38-40) synthase TruA n=1 Tax=Methylomonas sp. LWB TaxID=1905845 RepID=UPI0008D9ADA2|nr:tRNA pseudouridine(38-40) synthase TruA [Methylomonas sp. LWB]OHX35206.1 tRNA pseudouridine(38-40) synthase TruA [Methylomonas sp. LWB]